MESPGPLDAIKLVVQHRLVTATYLSDARLQMAVDLSASFIAGLPLTPVGELQLWSTGVETIKTTLMLHTPK